MTFSAKFDALLQSKVAASAQGMRASSAVNNGASGDKPLHEQTTASPRNTTRLAEKYGTLRGGPANNNLDLLLFNGVKPLCQIDGISPA